MRDFSVLGMTPLYADLLAPIFRCKLCHHLFAPKQPVQVGPIAGLNETNGSPR